MWPVSPPTVKVQDIAVQSAGRIRDKSLARSLRAAIPELVNNHDGLRRKLADGAAHEVSPADFELDGVSDSDMRWLYDRQVADPSGAARDVYDALIRSALYNLCSYCQYGQATTLDHFLPKSWIAGLAIEPWNLVPACQQCNRKLLAFHAAVPEQAMFHPYQEHVEERWLFATLLDGEPPAFRFEARPPTHLTDLTRNRVCAQFDTLALDLMFNAVSSKDISEARTSLTRPFKLTGAASAVFTLSADSVRDQLLDTAAVAFDADVNSRRGAAYEALANSTWFCTDGFKH
jgi:hypothetical protein